MPESPVAGLRPTTLFKKRLRYRYFPEDFVKYLKTPFLQSISGRLLLSDETINGLSSGPQTTLPVSSDLFDPGIECSENLI